MKKIIVYTTSSCSYCEAAKRFLTREGIPFENYNLDGKDFERQELSKKFGGYRTVPMIVVGDTFIGGYDNMMALVNAGEFSKLIT